MKWTWLWKLTGGRPMRFIRWEFEDMVTERPVGSFMDRNGKYWYAFHSWDFGRVQMRGEAIMDALQKRKPEVDVMAYATVVHSDGSRKKEWVPAKSFQVLLAEGLAMLDAAEYPDVSSGDEH